MYLSNLFVYVKKYQGNIFRRDHVDAVLEAQTKYREPYSIYGERYFV